MLLFAQFSHCLTSEKQTDRNCGVLFRAERSVHFHVGFTTVFLLLFQYRLPRYLKPDGCWCFYKHLAGQSAEGESLLCDDKIKDCTNGEN